MERARRRAWVPVHVTLRRVAELPGLRLAPLHDEIQSCIRDAQSEAFRIAHDSIQGDHVHLIVEAAEDSLESGVRGFAVRTARRLDARVLQRRGAFGPVVIIATTSAPHAKCVMHSFMYLPMAPNTAKSRLDR